MIDGRFGSGRNFSFVIEDIGEVMIIAFAMTLIIITGEIDLSVASIAALSSCTLGGASPTAPRCGSPASPHSLSALGCGAFNGLLVTKLGLNSLAVTIGTLALFRGLCWALLGDTPVAELPQGVDQARLERLPGHAIPYVLAAARGPRPGVRCRAARHPDGPLDLRRRPERRGRAVRRHPRGAPEGSAVRGLRPDGAGSRVSSTRCASPALDPTGPSASSCWSSPPCCSAGCRSSAASAPSGASSAPCSSSGSVRSLLRLQSVPPTPSPSSPACCCSAR